MLQRSQMSSVVFPRVRLQSNDRHVRFTQERTQLSLLNTYYECSIILAIVVSVLRMFLMNSTVTNIIHAQLMWNFLWRVKADNILTIQKKDALIVVMLTVMVNNARNWETCGSWYNTGFYTEDYQKYCRCSDRNMHIEQCASGLYYDIISGERASKRKFIVELSVSNWL